MTDASGDRPTPRHRLLPHERWAASLALDRRRERNLTNTRLDQNYGPEGIALLAAGFVTAFPGQVIVCLGLVLLLASDGAAYAYWMLLAGVLLLIPGAIRYRQAVYAGRRFRGDRPFVKRP